MVARAAQRPGVRAHPRRETSITVLTRDGIFATPALGRRGEFRRVGALSDYVARVAARPQSAGALLDGVLGEAWRVAVNLAALAFCLNELIPLLRSFGQASGSRGESSPRISAGAYHRLEEQALELLRHLDRPLSLPESRDVLAALVGAPCAIIAGVVFPLERIASGVPAASFLAIRGDRYALRTGEKRPLRELLTDVRREELRHSQRILSERRDLTRAAAGFLADVQSILAARRVRDCGRYQLFHSDRDHQLQHCRGQWMLVRGPLARRTGDGVVFVGLPISGATRAKRLTVVPRPAPTREALWTPRGEPAQGRMCVGSLEQYRHLLSDDWFSDAEAAVQWLDAGAILATGRSLFHQQWRKRAASCLAPPPMQRMTP